ncbi:polysaccharide pyruvyl transferase family protein [Shewanella sp. D64]|uniref:polysaccharide pyruvyl transferase family protein n=1 Tax=unclassified Shewanella TaxID=196818 RepID=UPI0022BA4EB3|nr:MULTISPECIES: polysaccharide pyruvyl transferase family protein [unclassified Shewanella]MEC4725996.1 polysaccharide pyruvyl transferase family protein [Shewanella sp. D64]MEC4737251.1 polysaccharide pyruvyl transferase family protein [Shewanella sp. E94]WBJ93628.1 polysaccharide pyruvyl transferase family protein [Shewanella sp. MTB7]
MLNTNERNWQSNLDSLKNMHSEIAKSLKGKKVAYIDIPLYYNVGDILIYLGTEQFIEDNDINVIHRAYQKNIDYSKLEHADVIMFQGGGNFGDLYIKHQNLRERIIKKYPHKDIIMLPQTIYFKSQEEEIRSAKVFNEHKNLTFYVRDKRSFDIAQSFSNKVILMPDMAHSLHPLVDIQEVVDNNRPIRRVLNLGRKDVESTGQSNALNKKTFDWVNMLSLSDHIILKCFKKLQKVPVLKYKTASNWKIQSDSLLFRSSNFFLQHEIVHTDRLHGLILSVLLGRKVILSDNSYGKNTAYHKQWLSENPLITKKY